MACDSGWGGEVSTGLGGCVNGSKTSWPCLSARIGVTLSQSKLTSTVPAWTRQYHLPLFSSLFKLPPSPLKLLLLAPSARSPLSATTPKLVFLLPPEMTLLSPLSASASPPPPLFEPKDAAESRRARVSVPCGTTVMVAVQG